VTYLLDTNACIRLLNGTSPALVERMSSTDPAQIALCSVVRAELLYGARKSVRPADNLRLLESFFEPLASLSFDDACAERYGVIRAELESAGTPIGPNDLMIAATALANGATVVTNNVKEFSRVVGLRLEDWEQ
jgi:tRNA(fMet)-specific endonuclease VapC